MSIFLSQLQTLNNLRKKDKMVLTTLKKKDNNLDKKKNGYNFLKLHNYPLFNNGF